MEHASCHTRLLRFRDWSKYYVLSHNFAYQIQCIYLLQKSGDLVSVLDVGFQGYLLLKFFQEEIARVPNSILSYCGILRGDDNHYWNLNQATSLYRSCTQAYMWSRLVLWHANATYQLQTMKLESAVKLCIPCPKPRWSRRLLSASLNLKSIHNVSGAVFYWDGLCQPFYSGGGHPIPHYGCLNMIFCCPCGHNAKHWQSRLSAQTCFYSIVSVLFRDRWQRSATGKCVHATSGSSLHHV